MLIFGCRARRSLIRSSPEKMEVVLSISKAAVMTLPSSQRTSINSIVWFTFGSNCRGNCLLRPGMSPSRWPFHTRL